MTRINTNLSSIIGQNILSRNQASLQVSLTRLSTGLRINSGKDDPSGLIASQVLGRELTSIDASIKNTQRGNNIVATADAALQEVSSLLNDIRGLVQSSANKGAISSAEIASNQAQVDSALDSITRIAQTTVFGGDKLLNGNKAFNVNATGGSLGAFRSSADLTINSFDPSLHSSSAGDDVTVAVTTAATKKSVTFTGLDTTIGDNASLNDLSTSSTRASRVVTGATLAGLNGSGANTVTFDVTGNLGTQSVSVNVDAVQADSAVLRDAINGVTAQTGVIASGSGAGGNVTLRSAVYGASGAATVTATAASFTTNAATTRTITGNSANFSTLAGNALETLTFNLTGNLGTASVSVLSSALKADSQALRDAINAVTASTGVTAAGTGANATVTLTNGANGPGGITIGAVGGTAVAGDKTILTNNIAAGVTTLGTISDVTGFNNAVGSLTAGTTGATSNQTTIELIGDLGRSVITFSNDAVLANSTALVNAINAVTTQTGIVASSAGGAGADVTLTSQKYGSAAIVTANAISATSAGDITTFNAGGTQASTAGTDAVGTVTTSRGTAAFSAVGEVISYSDSSISFSGVTDPTLGNLTANFDVTGGALFQLGPSVNYANQVNVNITALDLATLGRNFTTTGSKALTALRSGGTDELGNSDLTTAASIVEQAISEIATLRGKLGALQKNVFDSNINSLQSAYQQVSQAQSAIRDADFAAETANLTKNQILVQAGTSILAIANQSPQAVLSLLPRG